MKIKTEKHWIKDSTNAKMEEHNIIFQLYQFQIQIQTSIKLHFLSRSLLQFIE